MNILEGIKYPTNDENWVKKVIIGGVLNIIPIVNFIIFGYMIETMKYILWMVKIPFQNGKTLEISLLKEFAAL